VDAASNHGMVTAVCAAGNTAGDSCDLTPASAPTAITVGGTDDTDSRSFYSSAGPCVSLFAPGTDITSAWIGSRDAEKKTSGTSGSAPHVSGVVAKYLGEHPEATPAVVKAWVSQTATGNVLEGIPPDTPNLLLFDGCKSPNVPIRLSNS